MNNSQKTLIVIAGPTASGKTAAGIELAKNLNTEIISADSRQFYREMNIGTAKPAPGELAQVKHHFINSHSITDNFNVGDFERQGLALLDELFKKKDKVIMVGGSGLYIKAICEGFDQLPDANLAIRERLNTDLEEKGINYLQEKLRIADPEYHAQVDLHNPQRVIRALEVYESNGQPFSLYRKANFKIRPFNVIKYGISRPREKLYERINQRVDEMIANGLIEEARTLLPSSHLNALQTVGYTEVFNYLNGKTDLPAAIAAIKQNTRRFAKRQMTWFNKDKEIKWLNPDELTRLF